MEMNRMKHMGRNPVRQPQKPSDSYRNFHVFLGVSNLLMLVLLVTGAVLITLAFRETIRCQSNLEKKFAELEIKLILTSREMTRSQNNFERKFSDLEIKSTVNGIHNALSEVQTDLSLVKGISESCVRCRREWIYFNNSCYYLASKELNWHNAQKECESLNSNLVVINSEEEQTFLWKVNHQQFHWIGLNDINNEDDWHWVDGTDYISCVKFWKDGEPQSGENADCVQFWIGGRWDDTHCSILKKFVCEITL